MSASFALRMSAKIDLFLAEEEVADFIRRPFFIGEPPFFFEELCAVLEEGTAFGPAEWVNLIFFMVETRGVLFGVPVTDDPFFLSASDFSTGEAFFLTALIQS